MTSFGADGHYAAGSRSDQRTIDAIFRHPVANNLAWRDVVAMFDALGEVTEKRDGKFTFKVGAAHFTVKKPHDHHLAGADVIDLRHFLLKSGCSPSPAAQGHRSPTSPDLMVTVDHHEARVYHLDVGSHDRSKHAIKPYDPHHFLHHLSHKDQPRERGQRAPEDAGYYEEIAAALATAGRIVVVGHGAGHSNAAMHLVEHLRTQHHDTFAHLTRQVTADFANMTPGELLEAGHQALKDPVSEEMREPFRA